MKLNQTVLCVAHCVFEITLTIADCCSAPLIKRYPSVHVAIIVAFSCHMDGNGNNDNFDNLNNNDNKSFRGRLDVYSVYSVSDLHFFAMSLSSQRTAGKSGDSQPTLPTVKIEFYCPDSDLGRRLQCSQKKEISLGGKSAHIRNNTKVKLALVMRKEERSQQSFRETGKDLTLCRLFI